MRRSFRFNPYYKELYARNPPSTVLAKVGQQQDPQVPVTYGQIWHIMA